MDKKVRWGIVSVIGAAIIGGIFYSQVPKRSKELDAADKLNTSKSNARKALNVNAFIIKPQLLTDEIQISGNLIPDEETNLSFETSGKIVEINFNEGTEVRKGQLLAKVNDRALQAQLLKLESQLKLAQDRVYRQSALLKKDAVSQEALEKVETELATLNADIELVKSNIAHTELKAPFDGVIGLRQVSLGQYASPSTIIAKLTKISPLKVEFAVPERYAGDITKGTNITFKVEGKLKEFSAKVYASESKIDPATHTLPIRALFPNINGELLPGRYVSVTLKRREIENAIAVPSQAIVPEMGRDLIYLYKNGKAEPSVVTTGLRTEGEIQILKGLSIGDTIIVSGILQLRSGLTVALDNIY